MTENLSNSGFEMLRFEHKTIVDLVKELNDRLDNAPDLKPFERQMWKARLELLLEFAEASGELIKLNLKAQEISETHRQTGLN